MNILGNGHAGQFEECGCVVDVLHHLLDVALALEALGKAHYKGCAERLLVHKALVKPAVLTHIETLVRGVNHQRVILQAIRLQIIQHAANVVINRLYNLCVVTHIALELPLCKVVALRILGVVVLGNLAVELVINSLLLGCEAAYGILV